MLVDSWKVLETLVITNTMKALLSEQKNSVDIFNFYA